MAQEYHPSPCNARGGRRSAIDRRRAYSVDDALLLPQDDAMAEDAKGDRRALWIFLTVGAVVGLCLGILVSLTTDVPFAPEIGIVIGLVAGWSVRRLRA
jgi:hypothetical protein